MTTSPIFIELPWPDTRLSPNARLHWAEKSRIAANTKAQAAWAARAANAHTLKGAKRLEAVITFYPPNNRRRDMDNMIASVKSQIDGIASVVGVDDSRWVMSFMKGDTAHPHGCVSYAIFALEAAE